MPPKRQIARETSGRYRTRMRAQGFRSIQLWVPDTRLPGFAAECRRQSQSIARSPETELGEFLDSAVREIEGWK